MNNQWILSTILTQASFYFSHAKPLRYAPPVPVCRTRGNSVLGMQY